MNQNIIQSIHTWFQQAVPQPTATNQAVQLGCHFEEVAEMLEALQINPKEINKIAYSLKRNPEAWREDLTELNAEQRTALLDALCDQIVTAIGVAHMFGFDIQGSLSEVNRSNWSKFVDGQPVFDENGKIAKPNTYSPPNLKPFVYGWD